ncbi:MAG: bifunctional adenosylcobinamide kinase/adenosylcobinamide-phosphate guanylyltransferase [Coriobacteriales bacterium]
MALVLITGGARCGKSAVAERLAVQRQDSGCPVTVAVFGNPSGDDLEFAERIRHHRENRPTSFSTIEAFEKRDWLEEVPDDATLLVDSLGTALSAIMVHDSWQTGYKDTIDNASDGPIGRRFGELVQQLIDREGDTIIVTNEVGDAPAPGFESGRIYRSLLGKYNRVLVAAADAAYLCVCGRLVSLSDLPDTATWPED